MTSNNNKEERNIKVIVRVRPLNNNEIENNDMNIIEVNDNNELILIDNEKYNKNDENYRAKDVEFKFDHVFDIDAKQEDIYNASGKILIPHVINMKGNATIFAYGQTGSGKTYTMTGPSISKPGVTQLSLYDLFNNVDMTDIHSINVMYIEIYNEQIRDLLNNDKKQSISLRENPTEGVILQPIITRQVSCIEDVNNILDEGANNRTVDSHQLNQASSRSHAIFQITVMNKDGIHRTKLTLIDLAGAEGVRKTGVTSSKMRKEGANINKSLLALSNCINALSHRRKKGLYVPYRDSKLTRLLKDSLTGGSKTIMIANVSPASTNRPESRETLLYAHRCMSITAKPKRNHIKMDLNYYKNTVVSLKTQLKELQRAINIDTNTNISNKTNITKRNSVIEIQTTENLREKLQENTNELVELKMKFSEMLEQHQVNQELLKELNYMIDYWFKNDYCKEPDISIIDKRASIILKAPKFRRTPTMDDDITNININKVIELLNSPGKVSVPFYIKEKVDEREVLLQNIETNNIEQNHVEQKLIELLQTKQYLIEQVKQTSLRQERQQLLEATIQQCDLELNNCDLQLQLMVFKNLLDSNDDFQNEVLEVVKLEAEKKLKNSSQIVSPIANSTKSTMKSSRSAKLLKRTRARLKARLYLTAKVTSRNALHRRSKTEAKLDLPNLDYTLNNKQINMIDNINTKSNRSFSNDDIISSSESDHDNEMNSQMITHKSKSNATEELSLKDVIESPIYVYTVAVLLIIIAMLVQK